MLAASFADPLLPCPRGMTMIDVLDSWHVGTRGPDGTMAYSALASVLNAAVRLPWRERPRRRNAQGGGDRAALVVALRGD